MKVKKLIAVIAIFFTLPAFAQQYDPSLIPYRQGNLWGYAHPDKTIAIKPAYDESNWFVAGFAVVKKGAKFGYINREGKVVIPFKFYAAKPFTYGYFDNKGKHTAGGKLIKNEDTVLFAGAALTPNGAEVCIDTKGRTMSKCPAINENRPGNNLQLVNVTAEKVYGLVNNANLYDKILDDYKLAGDEHTYYVAVKNNRYGLINNTFDVLLPFEYDSIKRTDINGTAYLQASKNNRYGMYTGTGNVFIPVEKTKLIFVKGTQDKPYFIVAKDGITALKDFNQQDITGSNYQDIQYEENRGFILTATDNTKGYYFLDTKFIAPKYSELRSVRGGNYLLVKTVAGQTGYVNAEGTEFFNE